MRVIQHDYTDMERPIGSPVVDAEGQIHITQYPGSYIFVDRPDFFACNYVNRGRIGYCFFLDNNGTEKVTWSNLSPEHRLTFRAVLKRSIYSLGDLEMFHLKTEEEYALEVLEEL